MAVFIPPTDGPEKCSEQAGRPAAFEPPEYTMKEIYDNIPPHCLQPNTLVSLYYILRDYFFVLVLVSVATQIPNISYPYLRSLAWATYAFLQGLVFTGLWELAHECGHGALSKSKAFNNTCGLIIHSLLLVPYYSWKITHSTHHKTTNNLDKDIAFVPTIKEAYQAARESHSKAWDYIEDMPLVALIHLFFHHGCGLITGFVCLPLKLNEAYSSIPYYPTKTWTFLRGAASTVDRDFGFIGRVIFHGAIETHVMHHHVSRIPFYHAIEATAAVRKVMGSHYQSDFKTPYIWAFWKNYRTCKFVEETEQSSQIYFFPKTE
ncbi:hypothetical protein EG329_004875 [Mollisiaceae sp. DMI_Dod_QoI]|nr:hypothetical protein EG329_004875 [Helotiales sp. DMI_Dod_QoI]